MMRLQAGYYFFTCWIIGQWGGVVDAESTSLRSTFLWQSWNDDGGHNNNHIVDHRRRLEDESVTEDGLLDRIRRPRRPANDETEDETEEPLVDDTSSPRPTPNTGSPRPTPLEDSDRDTPRPTPTALAPPTTKSPPPPVAAPAPVVTAPAPVVVPVAPPSGETVDDYVVMDDYATTPATDDGEEEDEDELSYDDDTMASSSSSSSSSSSGSSSSTTTTTDDAFVVDDASEEEAVDNADDAVPITTDATAAPTAPIAPPVVASTLSPATAAPVVQVIVASTNAPSVAIQEQGGVVAATAAPTAISRTAPPLPVGYMGVVTCPVADGAELLKNPILGYTMWNDLVHDVNHYFVNITTSIAVDDTTTPMVFTLCPSLTHDAKQSHTLHIAQSNVHIVCGRSGLPQGCIVDGATVRIADSLHNVELRGLEFVRQQGEVYIGDASHVTLGHCRFTEALFPGTVVSNKRAAVVSAGYLTISDCLFARNVGQGAVLVTAQTTTVERSSFRHNFAAPYIAADTAEDCDDIGDTVRASAIQVGLSYDFNHRHNATLSVTDSCFDNNHGTHIVRVQPGAALSVNRRNAVYNDIGNATCNGIFILRQHYDTIDEACQRFAHRNTTCADLSALIQADSKNTRAPIATTSTTAPVVTVSPPIATPTASPSVDFLAAFSPAHANDTQHVSSTNSTNSTTSDDDWAMDNDNVNATRSSSSNSTDDDEELDDDDVVDDDAAGTESDDDEAWLDNLIDTLEQNETSDDAIVPLTDNFDVSNRRGESSTPGVSLMTSASLSGLMFMLVVSMLV